MNKPTLTKAQLKQLAEKEINTELQRVYSKKEAETLLRGFVLGEICQAAGGEEMSELREKFIDSMKRKSKPCNYATLNKW